MTGCIPNLGGLIGHASDQLVQSQEQKLRMGDWFAFLYRIKHAAGPRLRAHWPAVTVWPIATHELAYRTEIALEKRLDCFWFSDHVSVIAEARYLRSHRVMRTD